MSNFVSRTQKISIPPFPSSAQSNTKVIFCAYPTWSSYHSSPFSWSLSAPTPGPSPSTTKTTSVASNAATSAPKSKTTATILQARSRQMCTHSLGARCLGHDAASPCMTSAAATAKSLDRRRQHIPRSGRRSRSRPQAARWEALGFRDARTSYQSYCRLMLRTVITGRRPGRSPDSAVDGCVDSVS